MERDVIDKLRLEMRRGVLVLAVLSAMRQEQYGYSLRKFLASNDIQVDEGTLYPLIRRLEKQALLSSEWRMENNRRKRFYRLSKEGTRVYEILKAEWEALNASVTAIIKEDIN